MTCIRVEHQHRPIVMQHMVDCPDEDLRKIRECNQTGRCSPIINKIININDEFLEYTSETTDLDIYYQKIGDVYGSTSGREIEPENRIAFVFVHKNDLKLTHILFILFK